MFLPAMCARVAFCVTQTGFSLSVQSEAVKKSMGARTLVKVKGRVARCGIEGLAIRFYKDYTIQKIEDPDWQLQ
jgi:hypothetical protein